MSLVELMLLLAACIVFIAALLSGIVSLNSGRQLREERLLAFQSCRNVFEDLRRATLPELAAADGRGFAVAGIGGIGVGLRAVAGDPDGLPGSISVRPERTFGTSILYRVQVRVDWAGAAPNCHFEMTTLMGARR